MITKSKKVQRIKLMDVICGSFAVDIFLLKPPDGNGKPRRVAASHGTHDCGAFEPNVFLFDDMADLRKYFLEYEDAFAELPSEHKKVR